MRVFKLSRSLHRGGSIAALVSLVVALLSSGCMWGVVRDANTGAPIAGAQVSYTDSQGRSATATTDANGLYAFDWSSGPIPAMGPISAAVSAPGYQTLSEPRQVGYDDNPNASVDNPSSFWEAQHFALAPVSGPPPPPPVPPAPTPTQSPPPTTTPMQTVTADLALTDLFLKENAYVWVRVTNNGPDSVFNDHVRLECRVDQIDPANPQAPTITFYDWRIYVTLDPGQTQEFDARVLALDLTNYRYDIQCCVTSQTNDPDSNNDVHYEGFPQP